jgi:hypothetical protein
LLKSAGSYLGDKAKQAAGSVKSKLITSWTWCCEKATACDANPQTAFRRFLAAERAAAESKGSSPADGSS